MKKYDKFLWMALFSLFIMGACSSGGDDIPEPEPAVQLPAHIHKIAQIRQ